MPRFCIALRWAILAVLVFLLANPARGALPPDGAIVSVGNGSYQWGNLSSVLPGVTPVTPVPQPPGVKATLVGDKFPDAAIQTSKWWTSLLYKRSTEAAVPMNIINPGPLAIWSIPAGVGCRQYYYGYGADDPKTLPLNQGQPGLHPTLAFKSADFKEVAAGIGISNQGFGFDQIGGTAAGYGADGSPPLYPSTAVVEYSTWAVTYDTSYKTTAFGTGSTSAPRLRTTIARGSPYMWVEYPDGYPGPNEKPGYSYPTGFANYPFLQVAFTDPDLKDLPGIATTVYLPPSPDYTLATVSKDNNSNWVQTPINGQPGTKNAGAKANALAFTVNGRNYAAFGPPGTWWTWFYDPNFNGTTKLLLTYGAYSNTTRPYIVVAALPQNVDLKTLSQTDLWALVGLFKKYASNRPGNTETKQQGTLFTPTYHVDGAQPSYVDGTFAYNLINLDSHKSAAPFGSTYAKSYQYTAAAVLPPAKRSTATRPFTRAGTTGRCGWLKAIPLSCNMPCRPCWPRPCRCKTSRAPRPASRAVSSGISPIPGGQAR